MDRPPFLDCFLPADAGISLSMLAVVWAANLQPRVKAHLLVVATVLTGLAPIFAGFVIGVGLEVDADRATTALRVAATIATMATAFPSPSRRTWAALAGQIVMELLCHHIHDFIPALTILQLTWIAVVLGLELRASSHAPAVESEPGRAFLIDDAILFAVSFAAAALVADRVLERYTLSGDEWANTYQADVFAHFAPSGSPRACEGVFKNWWVFEKGGRMFSQYTPGWPLVMAPFQRAGAVWLAGPFAFGATSVGVARLARRIARQGLCGLETVPERTVRLAGAFAALAASAGPSALLNGASRYPHTLICACFAWAVESLFVLRDAKGRGRGVAPGASFGLLAVLLVATRPLDGGAIVLGVALVAAFLFVRRALPTPGVLAAVLASAALGGFVLWILRLQLGHWFATAYELSPVPFALSPPPLKDLAFAFRVDKGTGYWWPCSVPFIATGLLLSLGRARAVAWAVALGGIVHTVAYAFVALGRHGEDSGYGPRFHLPLVVPMAVGSGLALAWLLERVIQLPERRYRNAGCAALAAASWIAGALAIAPAIYPEWKDCLHRFHAVARAIKEGDLHHAVVVVGPKELAQQAWDLTQNLPSNQDPDTLIITDIGAGEDFQCARRTYSDRAWFVAGGQPDVVLTPFDPIAGTERTGP
jgi:hypothetical protein